MSSIDTSIPQVRPRVRVPALRWPRPELSALLVLAAALNLWALSRNGWANEYYSAAVRSMASSWHNFLYDAFDPSGIMTVDKPPLSLWVQALSVRVFGFSSLSVLVPQALMGVASVALVYDLTRRRFGRIAGFAAGLVLALTPISVAISRHNNPDALLVLCCAAALWFVVRGLDDGRTRWIVLAGVAVGLGFETKMGAALLIVPALAAAWLWVAPRGRLRALRQTLFGGAAMVVVGGAWPLLMALTPASDRPWISGTSDNSIWSLILNYNGFGRLDGQAGGPQAFGGGGPFGGSTGVLRLLNQSFGGQAGWLLGAALVGGLAIVVASRLRRSDARTGWVIAVGGAFLGTAAALSFAKGIVHPYYVSELAPFTAALIGGGGAVLASRVPAARVLAPLAVVAGVAAELVVLHNSNGHPTWLAPLLVVVGIAAAAALGSSLTARARAAVLAVALGALLIAPASWAVQTLGHAESGTFPAGGPADAAFGGPGGPGFGGPGGPGFGGPRGFAGGPPPGFGGAAPGGGALPAAPPRGGLISAPPGAIPGGGFGGGGAGAANRGGFAGGGPFGATGNLPQLVAYVNAHGGGTIVVSSQTAASSEIISSGAHVAGIGGFSGRESAVSVKWLADAVRSGKIRWVVADGGGMAGPGADGRVGASKVMAAVAKSCRAVSTSGGTLYDCAGRADALLAAAG